jgi:hypothetical protein
MRHLLRLSIAIACASALSACGEEMERVSEVTKLRLFAVQADPPEVAPGGSTMIRLLTADPKGEGRRVVAGGIVIPGLITPTGSPSAESVPPIFYDLPFTDANHLGVVTFPGQLSIPEYYLDGEAEVPIAPPGEPLTMTAITVVCAGDGFDETLAYEALAGLMGDQEEGAQVEFSVDSICVAAGADEGISSFKTFDVVTCDPTTSTLSCEGEYEPNENPVLASLSLGGEPVTSELGGFCVECDAEDGCRKPLKLSAYLDAGSFQRYERSLASNLDETELVFERTYISWFGTGGSFDEDRSGNASTLDEPRADDPFEAHWTPPPEGGDITLWAVVHDVRGGISWQIFSVSAVLSR